MLRTADHLVGFGGCRPATYMRLRIVEDRIVLQERLAN